MTPNECSLLERVWGADRDLLSRTIDTHIKRLREKLEDTGGWLVTVRGVGYRLQDPADRSRSD